MSDSSSPKILISGGGTGGHVFPAISIANAIRRRHPDAEILFVGAEGRMEMERVPREGYEIVGLPVSGFDRHNPVKNIKVLYRLMKSLWKARKIVKQFAPDVAVGVGGYASGPVIKAAQRRKIPSIIQEQNSYAGVTNRLLADRATSICVAYEGMSRFFQAKKIVLTGNPVREEFVDAAKISREEAKRRLGIDESKKLVFVTGGSLGAMTVNEATARCIPTITAADGILLWQTGSRYEHACSAIAAGFDNVKAMAFIDNMSLAYRAADVVVARAGACTISELQIVGCPAILIPSPNVAEDHQRKNAQALVDKDAAVMILDVDARENLASTLADLLADDERRKSLSENINKMALTNADEKIVDIIDNIITTK